MKDNKKRNKYLHKKQNKYDNESSQSNPEMPYKEPDFTKWYDELPKIPSEFPENKESEIIELKAEAEIVLKKEEEFYNKKTSHNGHQDKSWLKTVLAKGTASDKVAAYVVTIQDSPVYNLPALRHLVAMVKVAKKKECLVVMETLTELFLSDLLRPNKKLLKIDQQPLTILQDLTSGNAVTRRKYLCHWLFEDNLKSLYSQFVSALDVVSKDTVDAHREKAVTAMYKLLSRNPEQESVLLKNLVNKLGDPNQKVVSKVIYSLTQLLRVHPVMKQVVANEIERFLFRPNIGSRAQYYAICFLSQYLFTKDGDVQLAENLISIYFSFFKASIKKGDVDSRMMGALLMGVNRAYPYARLEQSELSEHVDTMYKLVHVTSFNISLQTLCLLYQIVGHSTDRFYCALYKKLLDPHLFNSAHQAMFINLVYKALRKDSNIDRVRVFVKRLLQVCLNAPSPLACALLYLVAELMSKRTDLLALRTHRQEVYTEDTDIADDGEERYTDAPLDEKDEGRKETANTDEEDDLKPDISEIKSEVKSEPGWFHCKNSSTKVKTKVFDGRVRNPAHAGGEFAAFEELTALVLHFHPTVALFARNILDKQPIKYSGDPLQDFTLLRFLERFVFKNPKQLSAPVDEKGPDPCLALRKHYVATGAKAVAVTSSAYTRQGEKNVPVDELFLYRYLQQRHPTHVNEKVKKEDDSDIESVASEEFDELLDSMVGKMDDDLDFADDVGDKLKSGKKGKQQQAESESDEEFSEDEPEDVDEDEEMTDLEDDDEEEENEGGSDAEAIDFGEDEPDFDGDIDLDNLSEDDDFDDEKPGKFKQNKKAKTRDIHSMFAPAEKFAEMLEEAGASRMNVGTVHDVSNKDNAALKQLQWESKRNWSLNGKRKNSKGKPFFNKAKRKKQ